MVTPVNERSTQSIYAVVLADVGVYVVNATPPVVYEPEAAISFVAV